MSDAPLPMLRRFRELRGWSRAQLAEATGLSVSTVQRAEADTKGGRRRMAFETAQRVAEALEVDVGSLGAGSELEVAERQRQAVAKLLLGYTAVHYPSRPGPRKAREAKKEATS